MQTVFVREALDGTRVINRIQSWAVWRKWFRSKGLPMQVTYGPGKVCIRCDSSREINTVEAGWIRCICDVMEAEATYKRVSYNWRSKFEPRSLDALEPWGSITAQDQIIVAVDHLKAWLEWPSQWLHITGPVGCGKSHILAALATELGVWALYITAADLESNVFTALSSNGVEEFTNDIKNVPVLLLDDIGMEYGSDFPKSQMRKIIDYRYLQPQEYVTVTTTNLIRPKLREYDLRISDRILDKNIGKTIDMSDVGSWRTQHANSK